MVICRRDVQFRDELTVSDPIVNVLGTWQGVATCDEPLVDPWLEVCNGSDIPVRFSDEVECMNKLRLVYVFDHTFLKQFLSRALRIVLHGNGRMAKGTSVCFVSRLELDFDLEVWECTNPWREQLWERSLDLVQQSFR